MPDWLLALGPWQWGAIGIILIVIELLAPGIFFLWLGLAAWAVALLLLAVPGLDPRAQLMLFAVFSVISAVGGRAWMKRRQAAPTDHPLLNERGGQLVGRTAVLAAAIAEGQGGSVRLGDSVWRVTGPDLPAGSRVQVVAVDGSILKVAPVPAPAAKAAPPGSDGAMDRPNRSQDDDSDGGSDGGGGDGGD